MLCLSEPFSPPIINDNRSVVSIWRVRRILTAIEPLSQHFYGVLTLKAVFQLRVFYTYVHARKSLNHFNITFEVNKCFDGENSAFPTL